MMFDTHAIARILSEADLTPAGGRNHRGRTVRQPSMATTLLSEQFKAGR